MVRGQAVKAKRQASPVSLRLLQRALDALADHLALLDSEGTIVAVNSAWRCFADSEGLNMPQHGVGANYLRVCDTATGPNSEEAGLVAAGLRQALSNGTGDFRCEYPCHSSNRERWFQLRACRFTDRGKTYLVLAHQCITPLKLVERALRESEHRYRALVDMAPDGVAVHQDQKVVYANRAALALIGLTHLDQALGRDILDFVDSRDHAAVSARVQHEFQGHSTPPNETVLKRADSKIVLTETQAACIRWEGKPAVQLYVRDITERKRQQDQLVQQRDELDRLVCQRTTQLKDTLEELEQFSYALIHDLRAPLRAVAAYTTLIRKAWPQSASQEINEYLARIETATMRMDNLVIDALNYSRTLRQHFPAQWVDLRELLAGLVDSYLELQAHASNIRIPEDLPVVLGNQAALTQCFSNLLRNAVKFVPAGRTPQVLVGWEAHGDKARIWVQDNGIGIPPEAQGKVFQMFQRLHTTEAYAGTGIGLAIAKKAIERIGGSIGVESESGKGSRFWVELKRSQDEATEHSGGGG